MLTRKIAQAAKCQLVEDNAISGCVCLCLCLKCVIIKINLRVVDAIVTCSLRAQVKALTTCFWSDFMLNPSIMYGLFADTPHKLTYDPDRVKVMGTEAGMIK